MNNTFSITDQLAYERTLLANERTFLAYVRTFIGFVASLSMPLTYRPSCRPSKFFPVV
ncbi:DUF202 domain-containing protein [Christensenella intestinihominis]|uniref:DUF202 domain-containing protein n=1 Tax=Christensenella intestinihominis TaxID=1851429 RepID=UPI0009F2040A